MRGEDVCLDAESERVGSYQPQGQTRAGDRDEDFGQLLERRVPLAPPTIEEDQGQRKEQVEMLFDSERPSVGPEARAVVLYEESFVQKQEEEFFDVYEILIDVHHELHGECENYHRVKRRIDFQSAADEEFFELDAAVRGVLPEEKPRNDKTRRQQPDSHQ